jgi:ribosomal protein L17
MPVFCQQKIIAAMSVAFPVFTDVLDLEKINFNKEKLSQVRQKVEELIARHKDEWVYGN